MKSDAIIRVLKQATKADIDVDEALNQLSDLVELAHSKVVTRPDVILSLVPLGPDTDSTVYVGWDTCNRCKWAVSRCDCKEGPEEPTYVKKFRQDKPGFRLPTPVTSKDGKKTASRSSQVTVPSDGEAQEFIRPNTTGLHCTICKTATSTDAADQNDDGTYTCHACQEASA